MKTLEAAPRIARTRREIRRADPRKGEESATPHSPSGLRSTRQSQTARPPMEWPSQPTGPPPERSRARATMASTSSRYSSKLRIEPRLPDDKP